MRLLLLLFCLSVTLAHAQTVYEYNDLRYAEQREELPAGEKVSDRLLNVRLPHSARPDEGFPVILYIHGGAFTHGSKDESNAVCDKLLAKGYAIVSIDYYLTAKYPSDLSMTPPTAEITMAGGTLPPLIEQSVIDGAEDAELAFEWLLLHGGEYGLDPRRVALMGGSSGAMISLYAAYAKRLTCEAVIDLWGELNYPAIIESGTAPLFILHGATDATISVEHAGLLRQRAEEVGLTCECHIMEGKGHAQYDYVSKQYVDEICDFLDRQFQSASSQPNELVVVPDSTKFRGTNVVVRSDESLRCSRFDLTDGYTFNYKGDSFTADEASYRRNVTSRWGTLCLPFGFDATQCADVQFYVLQEGSSELLVYQPVTEVQPYQPLIYHTASDTVISFVVEAQQIQVHPVTDCRKYSLLPEWEGMGVFSRQQVVPTSDSRLYYLSHDQLWVADDVLTCPPFRCYFIHTTNSNEAAPRVITVGEEDDSDGAEALDAHVLSPHNHSPNAIEQNHIHLRAISSLWPGLSGAMLSVSRLR